MEVWQYLQPDNPLASAVVLALKVLFGLWIAALGYVVVSLWRRRKEINRCAEVQSLREAIEVHALEREKKPRRRKSDVLPSSEKTAGEAFAEFCLANSVKAKSPIVEHIRLIFDAGLNDGRLDPSELCRHTADRLLRPNALSRSVLTTFIVIGLFGTLFGLADSLSQLSPSMLQLASPSDAQQPLSGALSQLLAHLKNAFAPSIWGIGFTVLGVFILGLYNYAVCLPLKEDLSRMTLGVWVPLLFPTTQGRLLKTLDLTERKVREIAETNVEHVSKVASFAGSIESRVGGLNDSLEGASKTIDSATEAMRLLTQFTTELQGFGSKFGQAVTGISQFQSQITLLYKQLLDESKGFHDRVKDDIAAGQRFQENMRETIGEQHEQLKELYQKISIYEEGYLTHRKSLDAGIEETLKAAKQAFADIAIRNDQIVDALGGPLKQTLDVRLTAIEKAMADNLTGIEERMRAGLHSIQDRFITFDRPIKDAADEIKKAHGEIVKNMILLMKELQGEFARQNKLNSEEVVKLNQVNSRIEALLSEISKTADSQQQDAQSLSGHVGSLAERVASLSGVIAAADRTFQLSERQIGQLELLERQTKALVESVNLSMRRSEQQAAEVRAHTSRLGEFMTSVSNWFGVLQRREQLREQQQAAMRDRPRPVETGPIRRSTEEARRGAETDRIPRRRDVAIPRGQRSEAPGSLQTDRLVAEPLSRNTTPLTAADLSFGQRGSDGAKPQPMPIAAGGDSVLASNTSEEPNAAASIEHDRTILEDDDEKSAARDSSSESFDEARMNAQESPLDAISAEELLDSPSVGAIEPTDQPAVPITTKVGGGRKAKKGRVWSRFTEEVLSRWR